MHFQSKSVFSFKIPFQLNRTPRFNGEKNNQKDSIVLPMKMDEYGRIWKNIYYLKINGRWGLYDDNQLPFTANTIFFNEVLKSLEKLRNAGEFGKTFIENIDTIENDIVIRPWEGLNGTYGRYIYLNAQLNETVLTEKGSQTIKFELILCHELAHAFAFIRGTKFEEWLGELYNEDGDEKAISYSEIYATHIENEFRIEMGYPLRKYYAQDSNRNPVFESKILDDNNKNLFYHNGDIEPHTAYKVIAKEDRYVYRMD
ncbi:MAG TPA: M91 family zinc metallopeptidase [Flavisolibacter sp.]|nr:M91 family zinc metallopeptidase [Flavisolibacter sp.]